jgi:hypothetical protein
MPWSNVDVNIVADKLSSSEAASVTMTYTYPDGSTFVHTEQMDTGNRAGFVARANAKLHENTQKVNRQNVLKTNLLASLQASGV